MERTHEQRILAVMRKLLARIVRELAPKPGMRHPLSERTIADIRAAFDLISVRERELLRAGGGAEARPRYADAPKTSHAVPAPKPARRSDA